MASAAFGSKKRPVGKAFRKSGLFSDIVDDLYKKVEQGFVAVEAAAAAAAAAGDLHDMCLVASVAGNITPLSGVAKTISGVAIDTAGMRVLLTAQTTHSQNGPWVVASGAWTRPTDFAAGASVQTGNLFPISDKDNTNPDTTWVVSADTPAATLTVGTTLISFTKSSIAGFAAPGATGVATASTAGTSNAGARADHAHQSNTAATTQGMGDVAAIGTSGEPARADHAHGLVKETVRAASTANITNSPATFGATLTASGNGAFDTVDGITLTATQTVLLKNQTETKQNGVWVLTQVGSGGTPWILTRQAGWAVGNLLAGKDTWVQEGTTLTRSRWTVVTASGSDVAGTNAITFAQYHLTAGQSTISMQSKEVVSVGGPTATTSAQVRAPVVDTYSNISPQVLTLTNQTVIAKSSTGNVGLRLPAAASSSGIWYTVKHFNTTNANTCILLQNADSAKIENVNGNYTIPAGSSVTVVCDGTEWWVV